MCWNVYLIICNIYVDWTRLATKWIVIGVYHKINCMEDNSQCCWFVMYYIIYRDVISKGFKYQQVNVFALYWEKNTSSVALDVLCCDHNFYVKHWNFAQTKTLIYLPWKLSMIADSEEYMFCVSNILICRGDEMRRSYANAFWIESNVWVLTLYCLYI